MTCQIVQTPPEFIQAVMQAFGVRAWNRDLAANAENAVTPCYYGPGSVLGEDSLAQDWVGHDGDFWLNPPFEDIEPWVKKCAESAPWRHGRIFALLLASVGSEWYRKWVKNVAQTIALSPRLTFVGHKHPYPKDLILAVYGPVCGGFSDWRWDEPGKRIAKRQNDIRLAAEVRPADPLVLPGQIQLVVA